jgi:ERCC4-type nuclease
MLYGDISERQYVHDAFKERLGKEYQIKELGCYDCKDKKVLLEKSGKIVCVDGEEVSLLCSYGFNNTQNRTVCQNCSSKKYVRFADFEIGTGRAFYERKTPADFAASQKSRLYSQLTRIDTFVQGHKGLILEGTPNLVKGEDSFFSGYQNNIKKLQGLSPLRQAIKISGNKNWTLSFIRELKMRDMEFVQTYDLEETIDFLIQCDKGFGQEPQLRVIPKRYPEISLEQNLLVLFPDIGKKRSEAILKQFKTLGKFITFLRSVDLNKSKYKKFKRFEVFCK